MFSLAQVFQSTAVSYSYGIGLAALVAAMAVAALHVWFLVLEMFLWSTPTGAKLLRRKPEELAATAVLAKNQGLYNGFLAAGLVAACFWRPSPDWVAFFLACVIVAGIYGTVTASRQIFYLQALPGIIALTLLLLPRFV